MAFRSILSISSLSELNETETSCFFSCGRSDPFYLLSPPPSPNHHQLSPLVIIIIVVLSSCFLVISYYAIFAKYCSFFNRSITPSPPPEPNDTHQDFLDEDHGPVVDHPIWFIRTVGLQQSIINSITICKYNKEDGLIEGTECSVCLNEFQEEESLRLLPKCSHAFHLPCIDTWLRSHTNCPLCRAPIVVSNAVVSNSTVSESNVNNLGSGEETHVENSGGDGGLGRDLSGEDGVGVEEERELQNETRDVKVGTPFPLSDCELQVFDDLAERQRVLEDGRQPVRRSVSMDSSTVASMFCFSLANFLPVEIEEESSETELARDKKSNIGMTAKRVDGSSSIFKLVGSGGSSKGGSLHTRSVSMKRSCSSGGKFLPSRYSPYRDSILPL